MIFFLTSARLKTFLSVFFQPHTQGFYVLRFFEEEVLHKIFWYLMEHWTLRFPCVCVFFFSLDEMDYWFIYTKIMSYCNNVLSLIQFTQHLHFL
jgi:hypothetical protein